MAVTGDRWSTIIGPPSVLELVITKCPALRDLPRNELNIRALQHAITVSQTDIDYIVGDSTLHETSMVADFSVWGMDNPQVAYPCWRDLLRAIVFQVLSLPLDITNAIEKLNTWIQAGHWKVKAIGPSSHTSYLVNVIKGKENMVSLQSDANLEETHVPKSGRIAIEEWPAVGPAARAWTNSGTS